MNNSEFNERLEKYVQEWDDNLNRARRVSFQDRAKTYSLPIELLYYEQFSFTGIPLSIIAMVLNYNKRDKYEILNSLNGYELENKNNINSENMLIFGENLHVLKVLINDFNLKRKIDLIYI